MRDQPPSVKSMHSGIRRYHRMAILVVWIAGFLIGATSHLLDLIAGGRSTYSGYPPGLRIFWVSLTAWDLIAAALLALRSRVGIVLAIVIMTADILVNWSVLATIGGNPLYGVINQTIFTVVLVLTASTLWRWFTSRRQSPPTHASSFPDERWPLKIKRGR